MGLLQFSPAVAKSLGTSTKALSHLTAEQQLKYVEAYFARFKGKLKTVGNVFVAAIDPKGVGRSSSFVLFHGGTAGYSEFKSLDKKPQAARLPSGKPDTAAQQKLQQGLKAGSVSIGMTSRWQQKRAQRSSGRRSCHSKTTIGNFVRRSEVVAISNRIEAILGWCTNDPPRRDSERLARDTSEIARVLLVYDRLSPAGWGL